MESEEFSAEEAEYLGFMDAAMMAAGKGRKGGDNKKRFSEEQIKSLESTFETQTKLEPRKKVQLARELGLQPRQVAIWFQNKRARWKSRQLEREYSSLCTDYQALLSSFESLKRENQLLVKQLQKLAEMVEKPADQSSNDGDWKEDVKLTRERSDLKTLLLQQHQQQREDAKNNNKYVEEEEDDDLLCCTAEPAGSSLASAADQEDLFKDQQCCTTTSGWWDFWPVTE